MRKDRTRVYNILGEEWRMDLNGFQFILWPNKDASAWKALELYASVTPNQALKHALLVWLREHPCPGEPALEQMEMGL
jgi:hypothetical protein